MQQTYQVIVGWILALLLIKLITKSRLGYVIVYYILLLSIILIVVVEYNQITPLLVFTNPLSGGNVGSS